MLAQSILCLGCRGFPTGMSCAGMALMATRQCWPARAVTKDGIERGRVSLGG